MVGYGFQGTILEYYARYIFTVTILLFFEYNQNKNVSNCLKRTGLFSDIYVQIVNFINSWNIQINFYKILEILFHFKGMVQTIVWIKYNL